jgi:hypothetical protein
MMKMLSRPLAVVALAAAVLVVGLPSQANADPDDCPPNRLCLWHNQNFESTLFHRVASSSGLGSNSDEAHSVFNNSQNAWILYDDSGFSDRRFCVRPGTRVSDLGSQAVKFGDKISSVQRLRAGLSFCFGPTLLQLSTDL